MKKNFLVSAYLLSLVLGLFSIVYPSPACSDWTNLGLYINGGQVNTIALDKNNPSKIFAGTYYGGGLYRTDDGGSNWTPVTTGHEGGALDGKATFRNTDVRSVKIAPSDSNVVWVVHDLYAEKSTDGGATWRHISSSQMQGDSRVKRRLKSLAINPTNPNIVLIGSAGLDKDLYPDIDTDAYPYGTIYRTTDGGTTWTSLGPLTYEIGSYSIPYQFPYPVTAIEIDPSASAIYAISSSGEGADAISYVYRLKGGWNLIGANPYTGKLNDIKVKPDDSSTVFLAGYKGIWKFTCTTSCSSAPIYTPRIAPDIRALAFQPGNNGKLWVAGIGSYLGIYDIAGESFTWNDIKCQLLSLAIKPTTNPYPGARVYGGELHRGIIYGAERFIIGGGSAWSWSESNSGLDAVQFWDVAVDPRANDHYLLATQRGLYEKESGSSSWIKRGNFQYTSAYAVAFDPANATTYYAGAEDRVYKTTDGGATWPSSIAVTGHVNDIAVTAASFNDLYVTTRYTSHTGSGYGNVYRIPKDLSSETYIKPPGLFNYNTVAIDPTDPNRIFVGGGNHFGPNVPGKIYETTNATAPSPTWTERLSNVVVNALLIDPNNSNNIYAGLGRFWGTADPLFKSTDGGQSWQSSYKGIPGTESSFNSVTALAYKKPEDLALTPDGYLYAATERQGIYASANGGKNWATLEAPPYSVYAVAAGSVIVGDTGGHSLAGTGLMYGYVKDLLTGRGIGGAYVTSNYLGRFTWTDTDGSWIISLHPAGQGFYITASLENSDYRPRTEPQPVTLSDAGWARVCIDLSNDRTAPSLSIGPPSATLTNSGPVTYTVNYSDADSQLSVTLNAADVTLIKSGADGTVTVAGTEPTQRTVTVSDIRGNGTLAISIRAGTACDRSDNCAAGAGQSATFTVDNTAPNTPTVSGTTPTNNQKPTWSWVTVGNGGNGIYRYKLDSSDLTTGATETAGTSYTQATNLAEGMHTLYVQERDAAGNWSSSGSFAIKIVMKGDLDGNDIVDLRDAILALKMISALPTGMDVYSGADLNGDERIGMAEILYILQRIAQMRN